MVRTKWLVAMAGGALVLAGATASGQVRISQVGKSSGLDPNAYNGNFVELFNAGNAPVVLDGKSIQWASSPAGSSWTKFDLSGTIQPGRYWLVRLTSTNAGPDPRAGFGMPFDADQNRVGFNGTFTTVTFSNSGGKVALVDGVTALSGNGCGNAAVLDLVGFDDVPSTAACHEGSACALIPVPGDFAGGIGTTGVVRVCGGLQDTDDNFADFTSYSRPPRNSSYSGAPDVPDVSAKSVVTGQAARGVNTGYAGQTVLFSANVRACSGAVSSLAINLQPLGDSASQPLFDDGTNGDVTANDGVWSYLYTIPAGAPVAKHMLVLTATDSNGRVGAGETLLEVGPVPPANDVCAGATAVPALPRPMFSSVEGTLLTATPVTTILTTCSSSTGTSRDLWYTFTPVESGAYTITTCNSVTGPTLFTGMATNITLFESCPAEGLTTLVGLSADCNSNGCNTFIGGGPSTIPGYPMNAGMTYWIRVSRVGNGTSIVGAPFRLDVLSEPFGRCCLPNGRCVTVTEEQCSQMSGLFGGDGTNCSSGTCPAAPVPSNNECTEAIALTLGQAVPGTSYGASGSDLTMCDDSSWDVWYTLTPAADGTYRITTTLLNGLQTPGIAIFGACPAVANTHTACRIPVVGNSQNSLEFAATAGTTYYVRTATNFSQRSEYTVLAEQVVAPCPADFNGDGGVDGDDVIGFFGAWDNGDIAGDFNQDGGVDGDDVIGFFANWDAGC